MINRLFVYGSLAPGCPNEHILAKLSGTWEAAHISGHLREEGWGAGLGFPGIVLDDMGQEVRGSIFTSDQLSVFLPELDEFEGQGYRRVVAQATLLDQKTIVQCYIYELNA